MSDPKTTTLETKTLDPKTVEKSIEAEGHGPSRVDETKRPKIRFTYGESQVHMGSGQRLDPGEVYGLETLSELHMRALVTAGTAQWVTKPSEPPPPPPEPTSKVESSEPPTPPRPPEGMPAAFAASPITKSPGGNS